MPRPDPKIDRAWAHAMLDVWIDRALADPDKADHFLQAGGSPEFGIAVVSARPGSAVTANKLILMATDAMRFLMTGGNPNDTPIKDMRAEIQPQAEARRHHFSDDARKPSSN